jgi:lipopolysaccharide/colanic/teichoic acid biosynthesis glycosyltransferase
VLPAKLAIELDYLARRTLISDLKLIMQTIAAVFD